MKSLQFFERGISWHVGALLSIATIWHATVLRVETGSAGWMTLSAIVSCFYLFAYFSPGRN